MRGAMAAGGSQIVKIAVQFVSVVVLARLLSPKDFGIFAMVTPIVGFSLLFQDFGLTQALVTAPTLSQVEATAMFRLNLGLSIVIAAILCMASPLIGLFYHEPAVVGITIAVSFQIIITSASSAHLALLNRGMRFNILAIIDVTRTVISIAAGVAAAAVYPSPWALVVPGYVSPIVALILCWNFTRWVPSGTASREVVKPMLRFGAAMTTFNLTNYLSRNADNVMIGWARGAVELGLYDRAYKLLLFPLQQVNGPVQNVMVPILSGLNDQPARYLAAYQRTLRILLMVTIPGMAFLILTAPTLIPTLMGARWAPAVVIFQWLGLAGLHQTISNTFGWLFVSQRRVGEYARFSLWATVTALISFAVGLHWGATGVAAAYAISGIVIRLPLLIWAVGRSGPVSHRDILRLAAPYALGLAIASAGWWVLRGMMPPGPLLWLMVSGVTIYALFWSVIALTPSGQVTILECIRLLGLARSGK